MNLTDDLGPKLYSFAVLTDTHLNQGEDDCNSPFSVNRLANARMRYVVRDLNTHDLAFVINVGDLIHPVPAVPGLYERAAAKFHEQVTALRHDLYLTPGNHDIGDKANDWAPTAGVCDDYVALWEKNFGRHYQCFDHADMHFVIINAQIINSGLVCEREQCQWLETDLRANRGKRIFLNSHYPPYFTHPDEDVNYDNIAEPGRSWLLGLLEEYDVEALFIGHVHNFWYNRYANTDCYILPSTAFVRQDYSEMYRARPGPDDQAGRNDRPKLGYFLVHVHERGHIVDIIRTYGRTMAPNDPETVPPERVSAVHPRLNRHGGFGFDMRHNWMEIAEIPPTGGLDEFDRKQVRNDYPLMALWEMGIRKIRVPFRDLLAKDVRARMRMLKSHGHEFTLFTFGVPSLRDMELITQNQDIFNAWEIGINWETLDRVVGGIGTAGRSVDIPVFLSRLRSVDELRLEAGSYYHVINQGFLVEDRGQMMKLLARDELKDALDGFVFRLTAERTPWGAINEAAELAAELDVAASIHLRLCGSNPAETQEDDAWVAERVAEAALAANTRCHVAVYADTFIDNDRGYFVRNGVLDRLNNPRTAFHVLRHLHGALNATEDRLQNGGENEFTDGRVVMASGDRICHALILPKRQPTGLKLYPSMPIGCRDEKARLCDLLSGEISNIAFRTLDDGSLEFKSQTYPPHPFLLTIG